MRLHSLSDTQTQVTRTTASSLRIMIQLTRLNHQALVLNADLVKFVERSPDTVITLVGGEKMIVRESVEEVVIRIMNFRCTLIRSSFCPLSGSSVPSPDLNHPLPMRLEGQ